MPPRKHTYLKTHRIGGNTLSIDTASEEAGLREQAVNSTSGRAAKTLIKEGRLRVTLVALRKGAVLSTHRVEGDVTLQVLRGQFEVLTRDGAIRAAKGNIVALRAGVSHEAHASRDSTILITASMR